MDGFVFDLIIGELPTEIWEMIAYYYGWQAKIAGLERLLPMPKRVRVRSTSFIHYSTGNHYWSFRMAHSILNKKLVTSQVIQYYVKPGDECKDNPHAYGSLTYDSWNMPMVRAGIYRHLRRIPYT
jgi:hypothetical protein